MHCNVVGGEKRESAENLNISPSEICANSSQIRNDSACNASGEDKFTSQDKEYLLLLEEIQNSSICQKLEEDVGLPHVCLSQTNVPNFVTEQHLNRNYSQKKAGVMN